MALGVHEAAETLALSRTAFADTLCKAGRLAYRLISLNQKAQSRTQMQKSILRLTLLKFSSRQANQFLITFELLCRSGDFEGCRLDYTEAISFGEEYLGELQENLFYFGLPASLSHFHRCVMYIQQH
jgi:hypothetical protein